MQGSTTKNTELNNLITNKVFNLLSINDERNSQTQKSKKLDFKSNAQKCQNLLLKIFDYIHKAKYCCFFLLTWYDNQTYILTADWIIKLVLRLYCNVPIANQIIQTSSKESYLLKILWSNILKYKESRLLAKLLSLKSIKKSRQKFCRLQMGLNRKCQIHCWFQIVVSLN